MNKETQSQFDSPNENRSHPSDGDLAFFFYEEMDSESSSSIADHLEDCQICQTRLANWRRMSPDLNKSLGSASPGLVSTGNSRQGRPLSLPRKFAPILVAMAASLLIAMGGFYWGSRINTQDQQATIINELRSEIGTIKQQLESQSNSQSLEHLNSELILLKDLIAKAPNRSESLELDRIYQQLVTVSNQTEELKEEISSLAVNAHLEIRKNRQAVAQLYVNRDIQNQTFEAP